MTFVDVTFADCVKFATAVVATLDIGVVVIVIVVVVVVVVVVVCGLVSKAVAGTIANSTRKSNMSDIGGSAGVANGVCKQRKHKNKPIKLFHIQKQNKKNT